MCTKRRSNVGGCRPDSGNPFLHGLGDELRVIVGTNVLRDATQEEEIGEHVDDIDGFQLSVDFQWFDCESANDCSWRSETNFELACHALARKPRAIWRAVAFYLKITARGRISFRQTQSRYLANESKLK